MSVLGGICSPSYACRLIGSGRGAADADAGGPKLITTSMKKPMRYAAMRFPKQISDSDQGMLAHGLPATQRGSSIASWARSKI
jgi:hypothetical protein